MLEKFGYLIAIQLYTVNDDGVFDLTLEPNCDIKLYVNSLDRMVTSEELYYIAKAAQCDGEILVCVMIEDDNEDYIDCDEYVIALDHNKKTTIIKE